MLLHVFNSGSSEGAFEIRSQGLIVSVYVKSSSWQMKIAPSAQSLVLICPLVENGREYPLNKWRAYKPLNLFIFGIQ